MTWAADFLLGHGPEEETASSRSKNKYPPHKPGICIGAGFPRGRLVPCFGLAGRQRIL